MKHPEQLLPTYLIERATLRGNDYAWSLADIPTVIEAAQEANLISIGGQLQFRMPDVGTCECYWVEVDTYKDVSETLPWPERVTSTARSALSQFNRLVEECDFIAEGRKAFGEHLLTFETQGGNLDDALCFVWYVDCEREAVSRIK